MRWGDIEVAGREKYKLTNEWHLCAADASDIEVIKVEYRKKGPRDGWLTGEQNVFKGYVINKSMEQSQ